MKHLNIFICIFCLSFLLQTCVAGRIAFHEIPSPPTLVKQPPHEQLFQVSRTLDESDMPFILECEAHGNPEPKYRWTKNGQPFDYEAEEGRISMQPRRGTLVVISPRDYDEAVYQCFASNRYGTSVSNTVNLRTSGPPYWINASNNAIRSEDEEVSFECVAGGIPTPEVEWYMNGVPFKDVKPNQRRSLNRSTNILVVNGLKTSDTAVFQCNASNIHGYVFRNFYLNVLALPPSVTERPEPQSMAVVSQTITLRCRAFGAPKPNIKWFKERQEVEGYRFQIQDNGDLEIINVNAQDGGEYTCYATNKYGNTSATGRLEVKRKTKISIPPEDFEVAAGKSATFGCNVDSDPSLLLKIVWNFNSQPINSDLDTRMMQASDGSLTITRTVEGDSGVYTCVAKTELDQDEATATLIVQDTPNSPKTLRVQCDGLTASVEWEPAEDRNTPVESYTIQYKTSFTPDKWEDAFVNIPAPDTKGKVSMTPWANYTFRVIALNKIGSSEPSGHSEVCETPEDVPYKNPDNVVGKGTEKDNLVISWTPMPMIEQNAPDFFYRIFWKREDVPQASWQIAENHEWENSTFIIPNQPTFKPYRIKVEAHNIKGQAHAAAKEVIGYSGEDVPLEAPKVFRLLSVRMDGRSATLSWDPVSPESIRGHFRGYKIQTWTANESEERYREQIVRGNVTQSLVTLFKPYSRNLVRVLAFNDMYDGPASELLDFLTPESHTSGPVSYFDAIPLGSSALYLIWKQPTEPNGILTGYDIYYREVMGNVLGEERGRTPQITDPQVTSAKLSGLKPKTKYRIYICATTHMGQGEKMSIEAQTSDQVEQPPDEPNFVWSKLPDVDGKARVRVIWVPAVEGHPGSHFFVQYRKKGETIWKSSPPEENQDSIVVQGLDLESLYEIKVVAVDGPFQTSSKIEEFATGGLE